MFIAWYNGEWVEVEDPERARNGGYEVHEVEFMPMKSRPEWLDPDFRPTFVCSEIERGIEQMLLYLQVR